MIALTDCDTVKRYLAFRIIVNAMAFEDLVQDRNNSIMRNIRNTLLAHKQEADFFEAFNAVDYITQSSVGGLLQFMSGHTIHPNPSFIPRERKDVAVKKQFEELIREVLSLYIRDELEGFLLTNNFLAHTGSSIHEVSGGDLAGVFYRYNSSKALFNLAQYIFNNTKHNRDFLSTAHHTKLDMILHAQNMADCVYRDTRNQYSINGLLEICEHEGIGNLIPLQTLNSDSSFQDIYGKVRHVRNKLVGHIDTRSRLAVLITELEQLPIDDIRKLVSFVDKAVWEASKQCTALMFRYNSARQRLNDENIVQICGIRPTPYET